MGARPTKTGTTGIKMPGSVPNLVPRVSPLPAPWNESLVPGGGKRRDPGNEVVLFLEAP